MSVLKLCVCPFQFQPRFYNRAIMASSMKVTENEEKKNTQFSYWVCSFFSHFIFRSLLRHRAQSTIKRINWVDTSNESTSQRRRPKKLVVDAFIFEWRAMREPNWKIFKKKNRTTTKIHAPKFTHPLRSELFNGPPYTCIKMRMFCLLEQNILEKCTQHIDSGTRRSRIQNHHHQQQRRRRRRERQRLRKYT